MFWIRRLKQENKELIAKVEKFECDKKQKEEDEKNDREIKKRALDKKNRLKKWIFRHRDCIKITKWFYEWLLAILNEPHTTYWYEGWDEEWFLCEIHCPYGRTHLRDIFIRKDELI